MIQELNYGDNSATAIRSFVNTAFGSSFSSYREAGAPIPNGIISRWPIVASGEWDDPYVTNRDFAYARIDIPGPKDLWVVSRSRVTAEPPTCSTWPSSYGGVTQTFPTVNGGGYTVRFSLSNSPACATSTRLMSVSVNGTTYNFSTASASWATRNFVFNASGTSTTIVFKNSYTGPVCGPAVDNISVSGP